ncbi:MAG: hypothetical protein AMJ56_06775 [Anaerolineae bacterium SG8_19]|nr:MAG: hypothetical protein AMJ56_06775 [Anaerolineae bacterium SG8_19]
MEESLLRLKHGYSRSLAQLDRPKVRLMATRGTRNEPEVFMKTPGEWFRLQLQTTAEGIIWAIRQLEPDLHLHLPPDPGYMGSWPAARHLWHVARYERLFALPAMKVWLGEPLAHVDMWRVEDRDWAIEQTRGTEA